MTSTWSEDAVPDRFMVLLVDQDPGITREFMEAVAGETIEVRGCADPAEALLLVGRARPDAVVLGPVSGRLEAAEFLAIVRANDENLPIVAGAGAGSAEFAYRAIELGATMVVPRPYRARELLALLRSLPTHPEEGANPRPAIDLGRLRVDGAAPRFWLDGRQISLPPMEYLLLRYFAERVGAVITREELLTAVWGGPANARSNTLSVHIMRLRKRLGGHERDQQWIKAVRGLGYQFTVPAQEGRPDPRVSR